MAIGTMGTEQVWETPVEIIVEEDGCGRAGRFAQFAARTMLCAGTSVTLREELCVDEWRASMWVGIRFTVSAKTLEGTETGISFGNEPEVIGALEVDARTASILSKV